VFGSAEQTNFQPVTLKSRIHDGNTVRIPDGASIDLALIPAALAQMSGNSEIKIEELRIAKDANQTDGGMRDRSARIRLSQGKITILFNRSDRSASQFVIKTRQVTISADSDCLFRVQTDDTTARVTCERGKIYASAGTQPHVTITAGYFRQWPSAHPEPLPAADDATAQIDITESLEMESSCGNCNRVGKVAARFDASVAKTISIALLSAGMPSLKAWAARQCPHDDNRL
jgi:hypothetical protein